MKVLALDISLNRTGYVDVAGGEGVLIPPKAASRGMRRLGWIRGQVLRLAEQADLVVMEGYSYASKGRAMLSIAELGGLIRWSLWREEVPYVEVPPNSLKKLATGKGNASKDEVLAESIRRLGFDGHDNNISDALWLREAALQHYELEGRAKLPATHLAALKKIEWPALPTQRSK